jgi:2-methylcitrate dehydratase PrpD
MQVDERIARGGSERLGRGMTNVESGAPLRQLCAWATAQRWEDVPVRVRRRARWVLADDLAAIICATGEPEVDAYRALASRRPAHAEATLLAPGLPRTDRWQAASVNAVAASWCELDEGYRKVGCHAGLYTIPALIAEAEASGRTLRDVLRALVLSYECVTRVAASFRFAIPRVHVHALWSAIGAACATTLVREADATVLEGALCAAATLASAGPRTHMTEGILVRNGWAAAGALGGMQCADWAACGIAGTDSSLANVYRDILGATFDPTQLAAGLGDAWSIESGYHKLYACCQHGHSAVEAVMALLERQPVDCERVATIDAYTHPLAMALTNADPATSLGAKFSLPHMIAAPLVYRSAGPEVFSRPTLDDARVGRLRHRVRLRAWEGELAPPLDRPSRIVITFDSGERITTECLSARGGPDRPLSGEELLLKIGSLAASVLPGLTALVEDDRRATADERDWGDVLASLGAAPERAAGRGENGTAIAREARAT